MWNRKHDWFEEKNDQDLVLHCTAAFLRDSYRQVIPMEYMT